MGVFCDRFKLCSTAAPDCDHFTMRHPVEHCCDISSDIFPTVQCSFDLALNSVVSNK